MQANKCMVQIASAGNTGSGMCMAKVTESFCDKADNGNKFCCCSTNKCNTKEFFDKCKTNSSITVKSSLMMVFAVVFAIVKFF